MNIFVTGIDGFIGQELRHQCITAGHEVRGTDLYGVYGLPIDIRDHAVTHHMPEGCVVVHLAALSTDALCEKDPLEALDVNVAGTINVAKAAKRRNCKQFVFASTEKVYELTDDPQAEDIADELPLGVYPESKLLGEAVLRLSGLPNVTTLRFGIAYGCRENNWCAVEQIADNVSRGLPINVVSHPKTARRYVHVRDLCAGILASVGRTGHETFNLPGAELVTLKAVWTEALNAAGGNTEKADMLWNMKNQPSVRNADGTKARELLGWTPKIPFAEGMKEVVEYMRGRKHG